jgi:hypothetical protein
LLNGRRSQPVGWCSQLAYVAHPRRVPPAAVAESVEDTGRRLPWTSSAQLPTFLLAAMMAAATLTLISILRIRTRQIHSLQRLYSARVRHFVGSSNNKGATRHSVRVAIEAAETEWEYIALLRLATYNRTANRKWIAQMKVSHYHTFFCHWRQKYFRLYAIISLTIRM